MWQVVRMATRSPSPGVSARPTPRPGPSCVDAAERLLLEEGYAAVTSRRVGAKAGLKPQLVHYYFRTMDDLFLEVFRRRAEENLARFERAMAAGPVAAHPLAAQRRSPRRRLHRSSSSRWPTTARSIRAEIARYAERFRAAQLEALTAALAADGITADQLPPIVALLLMTGPLPGARARAGARRHRRSRRDRSRSCRASSSGSSRSSPDVRGGRRLGAHRSEFVVE